MHYTYVLQSMRDMDFYTGYTQNLKLRFEQHKKGIVESTKDRRPFKLIYYEACLDQNDAIRRKTSEDVSRQDVFEKEAQILFNRVNRAGQASLMLNLFDF